MEGIRRLLWRPALLALLAPVLMYFGLGLVVPYRDHNEAVVALAAGFGAVGAITFAPAALRLILLPRWPERHEWATIGLWLLMLTLAITCAWALLWRLSGQPPYLVNNVVYDGRWLGFIVATAILLKAPNLFGEGVDAASRWTLAAAWAVAIAFVVFLAVAQPDLRWLAERLQPLLDSSIGYGRGPP